MEQEEKVLNMLTDCWNEFCKLKSEHPDELNDFKNEIHRCQYVLGMRLAREYKTNLFYNENKED